MMKVNGNSVWKWIAALLATLVVSATSMGLMSYAAFFRDTVSRDGISEMIQKESPYVPDRELIRQSLQRIEARLERLLSKRRT